MGDFEFSADLLRSLENQLYAYGESAQEAGQLAGEVVKTEVMRRAHASPRWVHVADDIDTWDENDRLLIGVRSPQMISEAQAAEYGTEEYPPDPLMRTLDSAARIAGQRADGMLIGRFGAQL